ncbi:MAG: mannose-1-phosphate guanylyltransferase [Cycloclasticus sp. symbiont of Bathymodiolus heckerae]|nr:MAG: mannose-1-phosphate guanylyltransferase [Cycloclasticus sp. symbiont of Bathymodiolus heckerae]
MKVMILAAGRGERMGRLTEHCPKPLLQIAGRSLIEHHILTLKEQGFSEFVINVAYLGNQIKQALGDGTKWEVQIEYSDEGDQALETGGGILNALPQLGEEPFLVVNADVWTDVSYASLRDEVDKDIHLVLVNNPKHNPTGDFNLLDGNVTQSGGECYTYSGIGIFNPRIFAGKNAGIFPLAPLIRDAITEQQVSGELHVGTWIDVGTPERLTDLEAALHV